MYEDSPELECVECTYCKTVYPCECGGNEGIPDIDPYTPTPAFALQ